MDGLVYFTVFAYLIFIPAPIVGGHHEEVEPKTEPKAIESGAQHGLGLRAKHELGFKCGEADHVRGLLCVSSCKTISDEHECALAFQPRHDWDERSQDRYTVRNLVF